MTKQEGIKEGIRNLIDNNYNARNPSYPELIAFQPGKFLNELIPYLHSQGVVIKTKCPNCEWSQFVGEELVGMTPCLSCNSTGYIMEPLIKEA